MDMIPLKATARDGKTKPGAMRRNGQVPCVVYGSGTQVVSIQCAERELHKVFAKAGESSVVELDVDGKKVPVLFKEMTFDPISDREMHADFYAVDMKKEIEASVPVRFEGEAPAIKELGGVFVVTHDKIRVRCLPSNLPHDLVADISSLAEFHMAVTVKDLKVPENVKVMDDEATMIATIQEPRKEEEIAPPVVAAAEGAAAPGTEGAPAAEGAAPGAPAPEAAPKK